MHTPSELPDVLRRAVDRRRLVDTARRLIAIPSRTGEAGAVLDALADLLRADGFTVERHAAGHPSAPAVVVRHTTGRPGPTIQFNGHLDTVHLPFVPPGEEDGKLTGSGASDMKGGTAAAVEALRVLRDTGALPCGSVLFTAHDLHEAPWAYGEQIDQMIRDGLHGNAVLLPEPLSDHLPVSGRGNAVWKITLSRSGPPVHEVMRPLDQPDVLRAAAELVLRLARFQEALSRRTDPRAGSESVFVGQLHGGEIFNQYPKECWLEGTRRWLAGASRTEVEEEFRALVETVARDQGVAIDCHYRTIRDAFRLEEDDPLVAAFQSACTAIRGAPLPLGPKPFVDDGNSFSGLRGLPAITHGPRAGGQHTVSEWVDVEDLERVAGLYALTAVLYCQAGGRP